MSERFYANSANELCWYLADADTPSTPVQTATVSVDLTLDGTVLVNDRSTSSFVSTLAFPSGKVGGYIVAFTAAEITAAGRQYIAVVTVTIGGTQVSYAEVPITCVVNDGRG